MGDRCACGNLPEKLFTGPNWRLFGCQRCNLLGLEPTWKEARESWAECASRWAGSSAKVRSYYETDHPGYIEAATLQIIEIREGRPSPAKQLSRNVKFRSSDTVIYPWEDGKCPC